MFVWRSGEAGVRHLACAAYIPLCHSTSARRRPTAAQGGQAACTAAPLHMRSARAAPCCAAAHLRGGVCVHDLGQVALVQAALDAHPRPSLCKGAIGGEERVLQAARLDGCMSWQADGRCLPSCTPGQKHGLELQAGAAGRGQHMQGESRQGTASPPPPHRWPSPRRASRGWRPPSRAAAPAWAAWRRRSCAGRAAPP